MIIVNPHKKERIRIKKNKLDLIVGIGTFKSIIRQYYTKDDILFLLKGLETNFGVIHDKFKGQIIATYNYKPLKKVFNDICSIIQFETVDIISCVYKGTECFTKEEFCWFLIADSHGLLPQYTQAFRKSKENK